MRTLIGNDTFGSSSSDGAQLKGEPEIRRWFPSDTEGNWEHLMADPKLRQISIDNGWVKRNSDDTWSNDPKEILYRINKHGFRADHFMANRLQDKCAMFLGCSNMFGVGIYEKHTIPYLFAQKIATTDEINLHCINMGQPGGSLDAAARVAMTWAPVFKPKLIVLLLPPGLRREFWISSMMNEDMVDSGNRWHQYGINNGDGVSSPYQGQLIESIFITPQEEMVNTARNMWALKGLALHMGARFLVADGMQVPTKLSKETINKARDMKHYSAKWHEYLSDYYFDQYMNNNTSYCP